MPYCPECGEEISKEDKFCMNCRYDLTRRVDRKAILDETSDIIEEPKIEASSLQINGQSIRLWQCLKCNHVFKPNLSYNCPSCKSSATSPYKGETIVQSPDRLIEPKIQEPIYPQSSSSSGIVILIAITLIGGIIFAVPAFPVYVDELFQEWEPYEVQTPYYELESYTVQVPYTEEIPYQEKAISIEEISILKRNNVIYNSINLYYFDFTLTENQVLTIDWNTNKDVYLYAIVGSDYSDIIY